MINLVFMMPLIKLSNPLPVENIKPTFCRLAVTELWKKSQFAREEVELVTPGWWKAANHYQTFKTVF